MKDKAKSESLLHAWCAGVGMITILFGGFRFIDGSERVVVQEDGELKYVRSLGWGLHKQTYDLSFRNERWQVRWLYTETPFGAQDDDPVGEWRELPLDSEVWSGHTGYDPYDDY